MPPYSLESLYQNAGRFDLVVTLVFGQNTQAKELYGDRITGIFIYTKDERLELEKGLNQNPILSSDGYIKIKELILAVSEDKRTELSKTGILASDITGMVASGFNQKNEFRETGQRELPEPLEIEADLSDIDEDLMILNLNRSKLESGYKLTPNEIVEHNTIIYKRYKDRISKVDFQRILIDPQTGKLKASIYYNHLHREYLAGTLSPVEESEFIELFKNRSSNRMEILKQELNKSTEKLKTLGLTYADSIHAIYNLSLLFETERLTSGKFPVWWDFERFLHIYVRHVSETQIGERFEEKSVFQYKLKDIKELIKIVLDEIDKEIQKHFRESPEKDFKRHGSMAVYYQGDYYNIHIEKTGRLMTFFKQSSN